MQIRKLALLSLGAVALLAAAGPTSAAPFLIVGNDEKLLWDDQGKPVLHPAGKDTVVILDLADPENPKTLASLPLKNSVIGPPVNLAIDPTNSIALVADSVDVTQGRRQAQDGARQQGLCHRPESQAAQARQYRDAGQAALGLELQQGRHPRAGHQPRRQVGQRIVDQGHRGDGDRHHRPRRHRLARRCSPPTASTRW